MPSFIQQILNESQRFQPYSTYILQRRENKHQYTYCRAWGKVINAPPHNPPAPHTHTQQKTVGQGKEDGKMGCNPKILQKAISKHLKQAR